MLGEAYGSMYNEGVGDVLRRTGVGAGVGGLIGGGLGLATGNPAAAAMGATGGAKLGALIGGARGVAKEFDPEEREKQKKRARKKKRREAEEDFEIPTGLGVSPGSFMQIEDQEGDSGEKFEAFKRYMKDVPYGVAQDPVTPEEFGLTKEEARVFSDKFGIKTFDDVIRFNKGGQEDEEREDNEDLNLTVDAGMSPQDKREAGEY